jgi:glyoxylase-like metal-dependent hydrolase (beta-lactamase superfamily II)
MRDAAIDFEAGAPITGDLAVRWNHGSRSVRHNTDPPVQVHAYDDHTFVLRQNKAVHYEAPFIYLFCGNDRALLMDTGATEDPDRFPLRATVDGLLESWLAEHPRAGYELIVAHTHRHGDHVAGDTQFDDHPHTTVVPADLTSVRSFFGFTDWPTDVVRLDLGGRVLEVTGCPGHQEASIAVHDPWTGFLLTGDTVYPGRLYVNDFPAFQESLERLVAFARSRPVTHIMGCHIEMSRRPGRDYPIGATYQPDEPPLQMTVAQLTAVRDAAGQIAHQPGVHRFDDFIIFHGPCRRAMPRYRARAFWSRLRTRIADHAPAVNPRSRRT